MIKAIIELLHSDEWQGESQNIEIAKGKHEMIESLGDFKKHLTRFWHGRKV